MSLKTQLWTNCSVKQKKFQSSFRIVSYLLRVLSLGQKRGKISSVKFQNQLSLSTLSSFLDPSTWATSLNQNRSSQRNTMGKIERIPTALHKPHYKSRCPENKKQISEQQGGTRTAFTFSPRLLMWLKIPSSRGYGGALSIYSFHPVYPFYPIWRHSSPIHRSLMGDWWLNLSRGD